MLIWGYGETRVRAWLVVCIPRIRGFEAGRDAGGSRVFLFALGTVVPTDSVALHPALSGQLCVPSGIPLVALVGTKAELDLFADCSLCRRGRPDPGGQVSLGLL